MWQNSNTLPSFQTQLLKLLHTKECSDRFYNFKKHEVNKNARKKGKDIQKG